MAMLSKVGYGQVEPNHLSAQRTGQIYAQLPADATDYPTLQNGMFGKYDYVNGKVTNDGDGPWMLMYNEVKLYDKANQGYKDFYIDNTNGDKYPRMFLMNLGDMFTTNYINDGDGTTLTVGEGVDITAGVPTSTATAWVDEEYVIVKVYTLADGQVAVKLQKIL